MITCAHTKACLEATLAQAGPYSERGRWTEIEGKRAYITGPNDAEHGVLYIYDIFSFRSQSLQGADILAFSASKPTLVVMVDWFNGVAVKDEWMTSDAGRNLMRQFVETTADPGTTLPAVIDVLHKIKTDMYYPRVKKWGAVGFCWGGKLVSLLATQGEESLITVAAQSSPARLEPEEAKTVTIPMAVLASSKEVGEAVKLYEENLKGAKHVEVFGSQIHGWMSARGDLEDPKVRSEYERGYRTLVDFFDKHF